MTISTTTFETPMAEDAVTRAEAAAVRAEAAAARMEAAAASTLLASGTNVREAYILPATAVSGDIITLPVSYYPTRNMLYLAYDGVVCAPQGAGLTSAYTYEEIGTDPNVLSNQVRIFFDAEEDSTFDCLVLAPAVGSGTNNPGSDPITGKKAHVGSLTIYIRPTGDDANDGLTPETAKKTVHGAACEAARYILVIDSMNQFPRVIFDIHGTVNMHMEENASLYLEPIHTAGCGYIVIRGSGPATSKISNKNSSGVNSGIFNSRRINVQFKNIAVTAVISVRDGGGYASLTGDIDLGEGDRSKHLVIADLNAAIYIYDANIRILANNSHGCLSAHNGGMIFCHKSNMNFIGAKNYAQGTLVCANGTIHLISNIFANNTGNVTGSKYYLVFKGDCIKSAPADLAAVPGSKAGVALARGA